MEHQDLLSGIRDLGFNRETYFAEAYSRNLGLLTRAEQERLSRATVAIPGMGGVGGVHLITCVRTGIGRFHLSDFDTYEPVNVNRQSGARAPTFGRSKLDVMIEDALSINPFIYTKGFPQGISEENLDDFLDGVDIVLDGLDFFCFDIRRALFNRAREMGIPVVTAAPLGFSSALLVFAPDQGMSFDEYFHIVEDMAPEDQYLAFALGLAPRATQFRYMDLSRVDLSSRAGPSLSIAAQLCGGMAVTEAVRIILKKGKVKPVPYFFQFDPFVRKFRRGKLYFGNRNPIQRIKIRAVKFMLARRKRVPEKSIPIPPPKADLSTPVPEETIRYIIRAGVQAPSGDNAQPWKFNYSGNRIDLHLDEDADHSFFNVNQTASLISCGAVLENMRLAATKAGLEAAITVSEGGGGTPPASVHLDSHCSPDPLADAIWHRETNRTFFDSKPLSPFDLEAIDQAASFIPGATLKVLTGRDDLKRLARMVYKVDRIRTEHRPLHEHLFSMIRFTREEALEKLDGLPLKNLEAGLAGEVFLRLTRSWWVMNMANHIGLGRLVALHSYQAVLASSGACLLTMPGTTTRDFLNGGRALERVWLTLAQRGLAMQPMAAASLFWLRCRMEGDQSFSKKHRRLLAGVWKEYGKLFKAVDHLDEGHIMLFRLGYSEGIRHGTIRKGLPYFISGIS